MLVNHYRDHFRKVSSKFAAGYSIYSFDGQSIGTQKISILYVKSLRGVKVEVNTILIIFVFFSPRE